LLSPTDAKQEEEYLSRSTQRSTEAVKISMSVVSMIWKNSTVERVSLPV